MPITQIDIDDAQNLLNELLGNQPEAEAYSKDPEGWLGEHGYSGVSPEAVAQCGAGYGGGVAVAGTSSAAASSGVAGVAAALDPLVYNNYYGVDNSITNNIVNNGNLELDQTIGDGNVNVEDSTVFGDIQTQTGDGIQAGNDVTIEDSNVATGDDNQQAIDDSTNIGDIDVDSHDASGDGASSVDDSVDLDIDIDS